MLQRCFQLYSRICKMSQNNGGNVKQFGKQTVSRFPCDSTAFLSVITFTSDDAIRTVHSVCCNFYYSNQLDSVVLNAYLWTAVKRNLPPLDAFSGLFYTPKMRLRQGSAPDPAAGAYSAPSDPSWGEGASCLLPKNPTPVLGSSGL